MQRKKILLIAILALIVVAAAGLAMAYTGACSAHAIGSTEAHVILPADNNYRTRVSALNATSDKAASKLAIYFADAVRATVDAASTGTTLNVADTTGFAENNLIAVQTAAGSVIYRTVSAVSAGESLTLADALPATHGNAGDTVFLMAVAAGNVDAEIPVGAATAELISRLGVIVGPMDSPVLVILDGTSACSLNFVTWDFK